MVSNLKPELFFEVIHNNERGLYNVSCLNADIATCAANLDELYRNINEAVADHFPGDRAPDPSSIHLLLYQE